MSLPLWNSCVDIAASRRTLRSDDKCSETVNAAETTSVMHTETDEAAAAADIDDTRAFTFLLLAVISHHVVC